MLSTPGQNIFNQFHQHKIEIGVLSAGLKLHFQQQVLVASFKPLE
jgi:hypothetical protein